MIWMVMIATLGTANCMAEPSDADVVNKPAKPGIQITVAPHYPAAGSIPVQVTMFADMSTYYANNGNIGRAMEVFLVRRDAPGIRQLAKNDPHAIMQPDIPLPPPILGKEPPGFVKEERILDVLAYGARHEGGADYYVVGIFAGKMSDPQPLSIDGRQRMLPEKPVRSAPPLSPDARKSIPSPPLISGIIVQPATGPVPGIEGAFCVRPLQSLPTSGPEDLQPFVTVIAARVEPHGGVSSGSFQVPAQKDGRNWVGQFSIPASKLVPPPVPGRYRILVFSGDEVAHPLDMDIPAT
jgi:hypothetical protein